MLNKIILMSIFCEKDDDEGSDFYYLGKAKPDKASVEQTEMQDKMEKNCRSLR